MPTIQLQSSDGKIFDVEVEIAKASNTIKTIIEGIYIHVYMYMSMGLRLLNLLFSVVVVTQNHCVS